ncbi:MAG: stage V sporulation protein AA [Clostridiales bacterium]|jgi:stage V sporulation protein AA|nr:stage V sporulation protein AA [Clostridiales bacterium]
MDIYIKIAKKVSITAKGHITVGDVCELAAPDNTVKRINEVKLRETAGSKKDIYVISVTEIVSAIEKALPGIVIHSVGEKDVVVEYSRDKKKDNPVFTWLKIAIIGLIFAVGASSAIMSFHNDAEIPKVLRAYNKMFTGVDDEEPRAVQISYSAGLALGIIIFFNHIGGKKLSCDPTPLEIEVSEYDDMVTDALISGGKKEKAMTAKSAKNAR